MKLTVTVSSGVLRLFLAFSFVITAFSLTGPLGFERVYLDSSTVIRVNINERKYNYPTYCFSTGSRGDCSTGIVGRVGGRGEGGGEGVEGLIRGN